MAVFFLLAGGELLYSNFAIAVSSYYVCSEKISGGIRIVMLSDLHGREFGENNQRLLDKIVSQNPDMIALLGDIFSEDADADEVDRMCSFIEKASEIAPVYFGLGNHELSYMNNHEDDLWKRIKESGAKILESSFLDTEINGTKLRIGGYSGYYREPAMMSPDMKEQGISFAEAFEATDDFCLLLDHIPTVWLDWNGINRFSMDLVLSGHYHGGVIRIPIIGQGLYAPNIGKFPPYTKGKFVGEKATCILTTGMTSKYGIPRFFNPPEICVVEIKPAL